MGLKWTLNGYFLENLRSLLNHVYHLSLSPKYQKNMIQTQLVSVG